MTQPRPISVKLISGIAAVLAILCAIGVALDFYAMVVRGGQGSGSTPRQVNRLVEALLWTGVLIAIWKQRRVAVLFALALFLKSLLALFLNRGAFLSLSSESMIQLAAIGAAIGVAVPAFVLESTYRLWRKGTLT